jgi:hypothetical protein
VSALLALAAAAHADPMPGLTRTKSQMRNWDCERRGTREVAEEYPGRIVSSESRGTDPDRVTMVCTERLTRPGLRSPRDEALLSTLEPTANALATSAAAAHPELADHTWLVEVFYPSVPVAGKLGFAVKNALVARGLQVSDRVPTLGAGDLMVLTRLPPFEAWPAACGRYAATGTLRPGDALLAVVHLDPRETMVHAALCVDGGWSWLR